MQRISAVLRRTNPSTAVRAVELDRGVTHRTRRWSTASVVVAAACLFSAPGALAASAFEPVPGSPFASGPGPVAVDFSPSGGLVGAANSYGASFSIFTVAPDGVLTPAPGSPNPTGDRPRDIAFSPLGTIVAVANQDSATVNTYSVAANGTAVPVDEQPVPRALQVGFSPNGQFLAVSSTNLNARVHVFSVSATGMLTPVPGSPFVTVQGVNPGPVAYSPDGEFLAVGDFALTKLSVYAVAADGSLSLVGGPYDSGPGGVDGLAWNPSGTRLAAADIGVGVTMFSADSAGALTLLSTYSRPGARAVDFNSNGTLLATGSNTDVFVDSVSPAGVLTPLAGSPFGDGNNLGAKFSPNDSLIASASFDDASVRVLGRDTTAPSCAVTAVRWGLRTEVDVTVTDTGSGLASITNVHTLNATVHVPPFTPGTTTPVVVTVKKFLPILPMFWSFDATDVAGNTRHCDP